MMTPKKGLSLALALLLLAFCLSVWTHFAYGRHDVDADLASEMVFSALQNREGTLATRNWFYSSELRLLSPVPAYQLGLRLFSDWHGAQVFGAALMLALTLLAFLYFAAPLALPCRGLLLAAVLAIPISRPLSDFSAFGAHYSAHLALFFLLLGMLLRMDRPQGRVRRLALGVPLALYAGLGGIRLFMMGAVPIALGLALLCLQEARGGERLRDQLPMWHLSFGAALLLFMLAGLFINLRVLPALYDFESHAATPVILPTAEVAFAQLVEAASFYGLRPSSALLSARGLLSFASLPLMAAAYLSPVFLLASAHRAQRLVAWTTLSALLLGMTVNALTENYAAHYYLPGLMLSLVCLALHLSTAPYPRSLRRLLAAVLLIAAPMNAAITVRQDLVQAPPPQHRAAEILCDLGVTRGYATFWNGAPLSFASDGAIEVWVLEESVYNDDWKSLSLSRFLQEKRHLDQRPEGPVFVYLSVEEDASRPAWADEAHLHARADFGAIYLYPSADALYAAQAETERTSP